MRRVVISAGLVLAAGGCALAAGVDTRETSFQSAGYRLVGTLTGPSIGDAVAGVLLIPGSGPTDRDGASSLAPSIPAVYRRWAERLSEAGFVVLRYDKRFLTHRDLDMAAFDEEAQIADAQAAVASLRAAPGVTGKPMVIIGHSEGGTLAPLVAERDGAIAGVAIINAVQFPVDELVIAQLRAQPDVSRSTVEEVRRLFAMVRAGSFPAGGRLLGAGGNYWKQWIMYSRQSPATLSRLSTPLLLVQCLNDETLAGDTLDRNVAILRGVASTKTNARLNELGGHDHFGRRPGERESSPVFMRVLLEWLRETAARNDTRAGP